MYLHAYGLRSNGLLWSQGSGTGASELAVSILGPWEQTTKPARAAYERYAAAISALLGGEAATEVWKLLGIV
jgi:hypothetical protein